jgi:2,4-dienoyl-CoA reductase-like NADH-dependent reductase (Old Yellow Enzyme family)
MRKLFNPMRIRNVEFRNRIFVSPMCQYSCKAGMPNEWLLVHLGCRAVGGAGLVLTEATAISPEGRISTCDVGIWSDAQAEEFKKITTFIKAQGAVPGIQLAHAGRKASTAPPWLGGHPISIADGGWQTVAPSSLPFMDDYVMPLELTPTNIEDIIKQFVEAARRALTAGFLVAELHMAHGYLLHQFLSPLTNKRMDEFGGSFENRTKVPIKVAMAVREVWPDDLPLFVRISATDWVEKGWDLAQSIELSKMLKKIGVDLIDCSSGGLAHDAVIPIGSGFQVPFSAAIRRDVGIATAAVGLIVNAQQAEQILVCEEADAVFLARELLRDPYWPLHAANALGVDMKWPQQYERAKP